MCKLLSVASNVTSLKKAVFWRSEFEDFQKYAQFVKVFSLWIIWNNVLDATQNVGIYLFFCSYGDNLPVEIDTYSFVGIINLKKR